MSTDCYEKIKTGKNVNEQIRLLKKQANELIAVQMASASDIISHHKSITESVKDIKEGIAGIKSAFRWRIADVIWQIEQKRTVLQEVLVKIDTRLTSEAQELRKRGNRAFANGLIDDAELDYLQAETKNRNDFSVYISLGIIYMFKKGDREKAFSYFEKAIRYARPESNYYTSYALLHQALIQFDYGKIEEAEMLSSEAVDLSPDFAEAYYQNAQYNAQLKRAGKSIVQLEKAILIDKFYCLRVENDLLFDPIREHVNQLLMKLRDQERQNALNLLDNITHEHNKFSSTISYLQLERPELFSVLCPNVKQVEEDLNDLKNRINNEGYFDLMDIQKISFTEIKEKREDLQTRFRQKIAIVKKEVSSLEKSIENTVKNYERKQNVLWGGDTWGPIGGGSGLISFIAPAILALIFCEGWYKLWLLVFLIPFVSQIVSLYFSWKRNVSMTLRHLPRSFRVDFLVDHRGFRVD